MFGDNVTNTEIFIIDQDLVTILSRKVAEDLNDGKELQALEMGVLYTKIPDSLKKKLLLLFFVLKIKQPS